jgi:acyl carrier protein
MMTDLHADVVRRALALHLDVEPDAIAEDAALEAELGLDPLDLVLVVLRLEEIEEIEFPVADLEHIRTVGDLVELVRAWSNPLSRSERSTTLPPPPPRTASGVGVIKGVIAPPRAAHR